MSIKWKDNNPELRPDDIRHATWEFAKVIGAVMWVLIRMCIVFMIAVVIGGMRALAAKPKKQGV